MQEHIRVGMPEEALFPRDIYSSEYQFSSLCKSVDIVTVSYPDITVSDLHSCSRYIFRSSDLEITPVVLHKFYFIPFSLKQLAVNGSDLLGLGVPPGPAVGKLLQRLLEAVLSGETPNERQALLELADTLRGSGQDPE